MKLYKRKGDDTIYEIKSMNNKYVDFINGARCKLETFENTFYEINQNDMDINNDEIIDPDEFFNKQINENSSLISNVEKLANGENTSNREMPINEYRHRDMPSVITDANSKSKNIPVIQKAKIKKGPNVEVPEYLKNAARIAPTPTPTPTPNPHFPPLTENTGIKNTHFPPPINKNTPPEYDVFSRVKKKDEIFIDLTFRLDVPSPQKIDALDDMFESSLIEYLSEQYIEEILNKRDEIKKAFILTISDWVDDALYKKGKTKKYRISPIVINDNKPEPDSKTDSTDSKTDSTDSKTDSTDYEPDSKSDSKVDSKTDSKTESKTDSKVDSKSDSKVDSKTDSKSESE